MRKLLYGKNSLLTFSSVMSSSLMQPPELPSLKHASEMQLFKNSLTSALDMLVLKFASINPVIKTDPEPETA